MTIKCPSCGVQIDIDKESQIGTCQYCRTKIALDDETQHVVHHFSEESGYEFEKGRIRAQEEVLENERRRLEAEAAKQKDDDVEADIQTIKKDIFDPNKSRNSADPTSDHKKGYKRLIAVMVFFFWASWTLFRQGQYGIAIICFVMGAGFAGLIYYNKQEVDKDDDKARHSEMKK